MEDDLQATGQGIATCEQEQARLKTREQQLIASVADVDPELDLCFETGNEKLAKGLIRKKLETGKLLSGLRSRIEENEELLSRQRTRVEENSSTLESLRQKAEVVSQHSSRPASDVDDSAWLTRDLTVNDDEVEIAFLRESAQRSTS